MGPARRQCQRQRQLAAQKLEQELAINAAPSSHQQMNQQQQQQQNRSPVEETGERHQLSMVCNLTARTSGNLCALHGRGNEPCVSGPVPISGFQSIPAHSPAKLTQTMAPESAKRPPLAPVERQTRSLANRKLESFGRRKRVKRRYGRKKRVCIATWPLARRILINNSSFGDCEDISSPHINGRLFQERNSRAGSGTDKLEEEALARIEAKRGEEAEEEAEEEDALWMSKPDNYNHRRSFGQPFERPTAGWIYNATGPEKINLRSLANLNGKFSSVPLLLLLLSRFFSLLSIAPVCALANPHEWPTPTKLTPFLGGPTLWRNV